jgi:multiple sugar transport system permease protein
MFGEQQRFVLFLIAPAALLMLLFQVVPIVIGANASFRDWALYNPKKVWVGLAHYHSVITDPAFLYVVLPNTFIFMIVSVLGALVTGLALALLLNRPFPGQKIVQTILLVPLMVAPVIAAIMIRWIFNDQFGIVNVVLEAIGLEGQPWLVQRWSAFAIIVLTDIWLWTPWFTLLLLAGLQSLPKEPFEAARVDGASPWVAFRTLTLPMLLPFLIIVGTFRGIDSLKIFDLIYATTQGGPVDVTNTLAITTYFQAIRWTNFGTAMSYAIVLWAMCYILAFILIRRWRKAMQG